MRNSEFPPLSLEGFVSYDEKHLKQKVGSHTLMERRVKRDCEGNPAEDGIPPEKKQKVSLKYEKEARGMFGCYLNRDTNGNLVGRKTATFDYTDRKVVGFSTYEKAIEEELRDKASRVKVKRTSVWTKGVGGYVGRYGDKWREEVEKTVNKKLCCVKELIDHIDVTSKEGYRGTLYENSFRIFHDHLSTMWESKAVQYMKEVGLYDRLIIIRGSHNDRLVPRYKNSLPGNSPEHARGTDSHCFADMMDIIETNMALTESYENDDPRKFSLATPKCCMSAMTRAWEIVSPDRIRDDLLNWPPVIDKIIDAKGKWLMSRALLK